MTIVVVLYYDEKRRSKQMEKANKVLDLDGKSLGFAIKVSGKVNQTLKRTSEFIAGKDNRPILFNNIDIA